MRSNKIDASDWAVLLHMLSIYYRNGSVNSLICPERTGAGQTTAKELMKMKGSQLYRQIMPAKAGKQVSQKIGYSETRQAKQDLAEDLKKWFKETESDVPCALLLDEASTFIRYELGGVGHEDGKMDDCVIGMGCTLQASFFLGGSPKQTGQARLSAEAKKAVRSELPAAHRGVWETLDNIVAQQEIDEW
jgi:hypothetical protein